MGSGGCSGDFCGAALIILIGICGVAGIVGGIKGASAAPPAAQAQQSEQDLTTLLQARNIQDTLVRQVSMVAFASGETLVAIEPALAAQVRSTRDYRLLAGAGVDTVLEVALTDAGTRGSGINDPIQLCMTTRVRLVSTTDNSELYSTDYEYQGAKLKLVEWTASEGKALLQGLDDGYEALGSHIYDSIFLLYPFPDRSHNTLAPVYPASLGPLTDDTRWTEVDAYQPTLSWHDFPRPGDLAKVPQLAGHIGNVRYDLVVARGHNLAPAGIIYRRDGLRGTSHKLKTELQHATQYFWSVRARFELDGRERVTEWATTLDSMLGRLSSPNSLSYHFRTR
jgi:hypothetical protein